MIIVWSPTAKHRLVEILDDISKDDPLAAVELIEHVELKVSTLSKNPFVGRAVPEMENSDIRELVVRENYSVIYEVTTQIEILTIRHFRKQFP